MYDIVGYFCFEVHQQITTTVNYSYRDYEFNNNFDTMKPVPFERALKSGILGCILFYTKLFIAINSYRYEIVVGIAADTN